MKILFVVDSIERFHFFKRLKHALNENNYYVTIITTEPLAFLLAKSIKIPVIYLSVGTCKITRFDQNEIENLAEKSIEFLNSIDSLAAATARLASCSEKILDIIEVEKIEKIYIWNGQQVLGRAASLAADLSGITKRYLEISNLPNQIFVDPEGVNALSSIASNVDRLDALPQVSSEQHEKWIEQYENKKNSPLPQANLGYGIKIQNFTNFLIKLFIGGVSSTNIMAKIRSALKKKVALTEVDEKSLSEKYIFLPLQVSGDTQIKLHSNFDNISAIVYSHALAKERDLQLVVKIHPAEKCKSEVRRIVELNGRMDFYLSNENTINLIKNASLVVTINSTVGLEALLYQKEVVVLGRCFYKSFTEERLRKYIHHYLVPGIPYFGKHPIAPQAAEELISR